ncbi:MAG: hypothetical protein Q9160_008500 [Pyrenula sp. 1 TL-2023]
MNIADSLRPHYVFCTAGYAPFPDTHGYAEYKDEPIPYTKWLKGPCGSSDAQSDWRIDDSCFGVTYNAVPQFLSPLAPSRVDVVIPDQMAWSPETWSILGARDSVHLSGPRIRELGISTHLCRALKHWSSTVPDFAQKYRDLPFGSEIIVSNVEADIRRMRIAFSPNFELWDRMLSIESLQILWGPGVAQMPPSIDYKRLELKEQLSGDVCLVKVPTTGGEHTMVFKSHTGSLAALYHEVKVLLTLPKNRFIAEPPAYLVTASSRDGTEHRVCGFLMKFYAAGTLHKVLPERRQNGTLSLRQQITWAKELTSALLHVMSVPGYFYSDLRMDNVVLDRNADGSESVVLIDFEQSRNIYNWVPPEIYYMEWIAELGYEDFDWSEAVDLETRSKYAALLEHFLSVRGYPQGLQRPPKVYDNPPHGWYFPWLLSSHQEQEACEIYLLGKALYCLFEGVADADIILGRSSPAESEQRFPEFYRTPPPLRELIKKCTAGAREWKDGYIKVYRREGKVYPLGKSGLNGESEASFDETKAAIRSFWQNEMKKAEDFIRAKERYETGKADASDVEILDYLRRPTLAEVLQVLESYGNSLT